MNQSPKAEGQHALLEALYQKLNRPEFIHPDPLEFIHRYENPADREVVGLIAAVFAYGNVRQILVSVSWILDRLGAAPRDFILTHSEFHLTTVFAGFKHRWHTDRDLCAFFFGLKKVFLKYQSLEAVFSEGLEQKNDALHALSHLVSTIIKAAPPFRKNLLPNPNDGSACKRLLLFLRWMVRRDAVDPGVWRSIPASCLVVPVDTHMHRLALSMKLTRRKQADLVAAVEITQAFGRLHPEDPVRYDFCLTRLGIRPFAVLTAPGAPGALLRAELNEDEFLRDWKKT